MSQASLIADLAGTVLTSEEREFIRQPLVGGLILFSRNIESRAQVEALVADIRSVRADLILTVDQEGGRVQRLRDGFTRFPPMAALKQAPELLEDLGWLLAAEVLATGLDLSFTPVLDLDRGNSKVIGDRAFGASADEVIEFSAPFIDGLRSAGMVATGKHFPGHGGVAGDSHLCTPVDERSWDEIEASDLRPFKAALPKLAGIMPAHLIYPAVCPERAGFSRHWLQGVLRSEMGFDGLIFSDDLNMQGAVEAGPIATRVEAAVSAGCDLLLYCNDSAGARTALAAMQALDITPCTQLASLRGQPHLGWDELEQHPRRLRIQQALRHQFELEQ